VHPVSAETRAGDFDLWPFAFIQLKRVYVLHLSPNLAVFELHDESAGAIAPKIRDAIDQGFGIACRSRRVTGARDLFPP
jgi:hypothetical protein